jgi:hypothetical protein
MIRNNWAKFAYKSFVSKNLACLSHDMVNLHCVNFFLSLPWDYSYSILQEEGRGYCKRLKLNHHRRRALKEGGQLEGGGRGGGFPPVWTLPTWNRSYSPGNHRSLINLSTSIVGTYMNTRPLSTLYWAVCLFWTSLSVLWPPWACPYQPELAVTTPSLPLAPWPCSDHPEVALTIPWLLWPETHRDWWPYPPVGPASWRMGTDNLKLCTIGKNNY